MLLYFKKKVLVRVLVALFCVYLGTLVILKVLIELESWLGLHFLKEGFVFQ
uniref:Uncharacterized protein n=1 Tax=Anguilla anguilla TaxID=7936 RepID=A0A0E9WQF4_ANGAN